MTDLSKMVRRFRIEHRSLLHELRRLDQTLNAFSLETADAEAVVQTMERLQALVNKQILVHCTRERAALRPWLEAQRLNEQIRALVVEDEALQAESRKLGEALARLEADGARRGLATLVATGERIITTLIEHIHQEEAFLFPLLRTSCGFGNEDTALQRMK